MNTHSEPVMNGSEYDDDDKVGHVFHSRNRKSQEGFKGISEDLTQNRN